MKGVWVAALGGKDLDMMLAYRLVRLIEVHSDAMANALLETVRDRPAKVFGKVELVNRVGQFFSSAIYFATAVYDEARAAEQAAASNC